MSSQRGTKRALAVRWRHFGTKLRLEWLTFTASSLLYEFLDSRKSVFVHSLNHADRLLHKLRSIVFVPTNLRLYKLERHRVIRSRHKSSSAIRYGCVFSRIGSCCRDHKIYDPFLEYIVIALLYKQIAP